MADDPGNVIHAQLQVDDDLDISELVTCGECNKTMENPMILPCLHSFCQICVYNNSFVNGEDRVMCPKCKFSWPCQSVKSDNFARVLIDSNLVQSPWRLETQKSENEYASRITQNLQGLRSKWESRCQTVQNQMSEIENSKLFSDEQIESFYTNLIRDIVKHLRDQKVRMKEELHSHFVKYENVCEKDKNWGLSVIRILSLREKLVKEFDLENAEHGMSVMSELEREHDMYDKALTNVQLPTKREIMFLPRRDLEVRLNETEFGSVVTELVESRESQSEPTGTDEIEATEADSVFESNNEMQERTRDDSSYADDATDDIHLPSQQSDSETRRDSETNSRESETADNAAGEPQSTAPVPIIVRNASSVTETVPDTPPPYWSVVQEDNAPRDLARKNRRPPRYSSSPSRHSGSFRTDRVFISTPLQYSKHLRSIRTRLPDDTKAGPIVGITWVRDRLVLVDRWNSKVKLFREDGTFLHSLYFADGEPFDIANTSTGTVGEQRDTCALTIPLKRAILTMTVTQEMYVTDRIRTQLGYTCLSWDKRNCYFVCGSAPPFGNPQVDIIDVRGQVIRSFALDYRQKPLFTQVRSVEVSDDGIISVCDWKRNRLLFLKMDGCIVGSYNGNEQFPLAEPVGTCADGRGYLMVSDSKSNSIHIVGHDGNFFSVLKSSCKTPKPKEISIRPHGPPRMALSHGSVFIELFDLFEEDPSPRPDPSAPPIPSAPQLPPM